MYYLLTNVHVFQSDRSHSHFQLYDIEIVLLKHSNKVTLGSKKIFFALLRPCFSLHGLRMQTRSSREQREEEKKEKKGGNFLPIFRQVVGVHDDNDDEGIQKRRAPGEQVLSVANFRRLCRATKKIIKVRVTIWLPRARLVKAAE